MRYQSPSDVAQPRARCWGSIKGKMMLLSRCSRARWRSRFVYARVCVCVWSDLSRGPCRIHRRRADGQVLPELVLYLDVGSETFAYSLLPKRRPLPGHFPCQRRRRRTACNRISDTPLKAAERTRQDTAIIATIVACRQEKRTGPL